MEEGHFHSTLQSRDLIGVGNKTYLFILPYWLEWKWINVGCNFCCRFNWVYRTIF